MTSPWRIVLRLAIILAASLVSVAPCPAASINDDFTPVRGYFLVPPDGAPSFCERYREECTPALDIRLHLDAHQLAEVVAVNHGVNHTLTYQTDQSHWGVPERWDFAEDGSGDCEDFALAKRKRLEALGFPRGAMPLTIVRMPDGQGHAVLTLRTVYGDFVLDVNNDRVLLWGKTDLVFVAREDPENPGLWLRLEGKGEGAP